MRTIHNCDLTPFNSYHIPARCRVAYFPESTADVAEIFQTHLYGSPYIILGSGHNIILARDHYETPFLIFNGNLSQIAVNGENMTIEAGAFTKEVCEVALAHSLSGFEMFYDIPSSIGGAIVMNAGAKDEDIAGILETATYLDTRPVADHRPQTTDCRLAHANQDNRPPHPASRIPHPESHIPNPESRIPNPASRIPYPESRIPNPPITIPNHAANFRYRNSIFQDDPTKIVLSATFRLRKDDPTRIREKMEQIKAERWSKQPREYPNAGSVFKRPAGRFVGPMLDELGLKGHAHGGFRISPKHSGFIEKIGPGTGADLLALITDIQSRVRDRFEVELEIEQRIIDAA